MHAGQSTDAENSKALPSVKAAGGDAVTKSTLGSLPALGAHADKFAVNKADQTFQKVPAGI